MATVNLGRIKPVFKGAYAGGTAFVVDDIVTSGNETFICIQASTGNATSNATYWTKLASKGADGTNGTDLTSTLTTQGDILYRDGSGLQRLAKGTANQELRINSGATAPEWHTPAVASSDLVLLHTTAVMSGTTVAVDNIFNSTYNTYKVLISGYYTSADSSPQFRFRSGGASGVVENDSVYNYAHYRIEQQFNGGTGNGSTITVAGASQSFARWHQSLESGNVNKTGNTEITIHNAGTAYSTYWKNAAVGIDASGSWLTNMVGGGVYLKGQVITGIQFSGSAGSATAGSLKIYGLK